MKTPQARLMFAEWSGAIEALIINGILDSMSDSLLVIGHEGNILYANKITQEILGYSAEDFKKEGLPRLFFSNDDNYDFNQIFLDAVWKKSVNDYTEVDYHHPDGSTKRLAATTSYLLTQGDRETTFVGFIALFKDITEVSNLRLKERELTLEKERIAAEKIRSLHKLAMGVAHEIRNPMVTIGGFAARILKDERISPDTRQYAGNILQDARKLERLVDEIQAYCNIPEARLSAGAVAAVVVDVVSEATSLASRRNIHIWYQNSLPQGHTVAFDPLLLRTALLKLLDNAVSFSPDGSNVEVSILAAREGTLIEIKDQGSGIDEKDREFIFNPFFSTRTHAAGMGLAIAERIIHDHMGRIEVDSILGHGTVVRVVLPEV